MGQRGPKPGMGGRPKKAIADKLSNGNPGKRALTVIDFGDGVERLVVIYYDGDNQGTPNYSNYYLEVWEYDTETTELVCVCGENQASPLSTSSFDESAGTLSIRANKDKTVIKYESFVDLSSVELYLSLPNDDSAFIHYIETTGKTEGTTVVRTSRVDGREVSEEELNEITSAIYGNWKFDTYRWYSLTEYYDSETEAQGGLKPDDAAEKAGRQGIDQILGNDGSFSVAQGLEGAHLGAVLFHHAGHGGQTHQSGHQNKEYREDGGDAVHPLGVVGKFAVTGVVGPVQQIPFRRTQVV